jgi:hypothetical protein
MAMILDMASSLAIIRFHYKANPQLLEEIKAPRAENVCFPLFTNN